MPVTLNDIVKQVKMPEELVRDILTEKHGVQVTKEQMDLVFTTARKMGYDFKKLKIGKRLNIRKEIISDIVKQIESYPKWKREDIIDYLQKSCDMVERVHKKTFIEEFSG